MIYNIECDFQQAFRRRFRGQHLTLPDQSNVDTPDDHSTDPHDTQDFKIPDQQALIDTFMAGLSDQRDCDYRCLAQLLATLRRNRGIIRTRSKETSTIPQKYAARQKQAYELGCADGQGSASRRGSHVYEINTWLWNFGQYQPRVGGLSVAKTERIRRQTRSDTSRRS